MDLIWPTQLGFRVWHSQLSLYIIIIMVEDHIKALVYFYHGFTEYCCGHNVTNYVCLFVCLFVAKLSSSRQLKFQLN